MSKTPTPAKPLTTEEQIVVLKHSERVQALSTKVLDTLVEDTEDLPGADRWMIISRVVSGVFAHHFSIALSTAGGEMAKRAKAQEPPPSLL